MSKDTITKHIKQYGWHRLSVFDPNGEKENFSYTIGLEESYSHPEVIVFGLPHEVAHSILWQVVNEIKSGRVFELNKRQADILDDDLDVLFKPLINSAYDEYLGTAIDYYEKPFRTYVMFWPDNDNVLPTEPGCKIAFQNEALNLV
ncbi:MAG: DUF4262 domain-containing protein [Xanthomonadales bacterium]|jgi:hypothetical protein|nr:DUF4262 domain-containing protein [Xanthomonadales bacterium]